MNIIPYGPKNIDLYRAQQHQNNTTSKQNKTVAQQDTAQISSEAREIITFQAQVKELPDVRQDKIDQIKAQIQSGTYNINPTQIAAGMLAEVDNR